MKFGPTSSRYSAFAAATNAAFVNRSTADIASVLAAITMPLLPMVIPPAAMACHECEDVPGTQVAARMPPVGTTQLTSATPVEPPPIAFDDAERLHLARHLERRRLHAECPAHDLGEGALRVGVGHPADRDEIRVHRPLQRDVGQQVVDAVHHPWSTVARAERGALGGLHDAVEQREHDLWVVVAHVVEHLGKVRHHVRRAAAARDRVVDARVGGTCSRIMFTIWFIASTPSSAERPRSGRPTRAR